MKKVIMALIGISLFLAGYYHKLKQAEYMAAKNAEIKPDLSVTSPLVIPVSARPTFAFSLESPFVGR
ncbi:hypothetical protein GCM10028807_57210 [Spirosoma daeguense]